MKKPEEIKKGLECCSVDDMHCGPGCPYKDDCLEESRYKGLESDALAYIQQLEAQVPRWIPVEERLPEVNVRLECEYSAEVLVCNGMYTCVAYYCHTTKQWHDSCDEDDILTVTHWMPLPEAPKEDAHD